MRSSIPLFDHLASSYDEHFAVPHRRAYDHLAWRYVARLLDRPAVIIDAGCGIGRWVSPLLTLGNHVIGIEQSPAMAAAARQRFNEQRFELIEGSMEEVELPDQTADLTLALGSLQYTSDPEKMILRLARWTRITGVVVVLVDSLVALVLELMRSGKGDEARRRLSARQGTWVQGEHSADYHLFDSERLVTAFQDAGLTDVRAYGLLAGSSLLGREQLTKQLTGDWDGQIALEERFAELPAMTNLGKQLLVIGRR